jgi:hypothetical protein
MMIQKVISQHRNDFTADMVCEHCGAVERNPYGYHDNNYHLNVIPRMHCGSCGKNRAGEQRVVEQQS